jgi:hypothetical protein
MIGKDGAATSCRIESWWSGQAVTQTPGAGAQPMPWREAEAGLTSHDRAKEAAELRLQPGRQRLRVDAMYDV